MVEFPFKAALAAGNPTVGTFLRTLSPSLVEILGYAGLDFVIVDAEHGLGNLESMENLVRAAEVSGVLPLIRVPENSPMEIMRPLDAGFLGVQIPHVTSREDAQRAVDAAKFSPLGHRGVSVSSRAARYGGRPPAVHLDASNRETVVVLQIEDKEGMDNLSKILGVPGVDAIFVGQNDLSQSLGCAGQTGHPDVQKAVQRCVSLCLERGIAVGTSARSPEAVKKWAGMGMTYLCGNADAMILGYFTDFVKGSRSALERGPSSTSKL